MAKGFSPEIQIPNPSKCKCRALRYKHLTVKSHIVYAPPKSEITKSYDTMCSSSYKPYVPCGLYLYCNYQRLMQLQLSVKTAGILSKPGSKQATTPGSDRKSMGKLS